jgi:hypothetical protein
MYVIREVFEAKPGQASKLAKQFKDTFDAIPDIRNRPRVLVDVVGRFNTVTLETDTANLADFERQMQDYMQRADIRQKMAGYTDLYQRGRREIHRVVE